MTTATYHLANMGLTITFPKANLKGRFTSFEAYALWQAQAWLKHGKAEPGCIVARIEPEAMTASDRGGTCQGGSVEPRPEKGGAAPVVLEWPRYYADDNSLITLRSATPGDGEFRISGDCGYDEASAEWWNGWMCSAAGYDRLTPTEAAAWLAKNGHAEAAKAIGKGDALAGALAYRATSPDFCEFAVVCGDTAYFLDVQGWREGSRVAVRRPHYEGATATPAGQEAIAALRRWMEGNDGK